MFANFPSKELWAVVFKRHGADVDAVREALLQYGSIQDRLARIRIDKANFASKHEALMERLEEKEVQVRGECDHPVVHETRDPCGGSDHDKRCEVCGARL